MRKSYIRSLGHFVPSNVVTNFDLEKMMETSDEWIQQRSGIKERRWVEPGETTTGMALKATQEALRKADLKADDIDAIIFGCLLSDYIFPGGGCLLQKELGCSKPIPAFDIRNQCSAFPYSLQLADSLIRSGVYNRILIVGSEIHSTSLDKTTRGRDVSVLFGDGAGVCIVEAAPENSKSFIIDTIVQSEGEGCQYLMIHNPSPMNHPRMQANVELDESFYPHMEGRAVFKNAVTRMCQIMGTILQKNGFKPSDVDFVVAHQANMRINQMVMNELKIPFEKTHHTIEKYGNTTAATIPITMNEAVDLGKIKRGDLVATVAFGAGFTWGASLMRF